MAFWLILKHGGRVHAWPVGDDGATDEQIDRARALVAFPAGDEWIADGSGDSVSATTDEPPRGTTIHQLSDLDTVTAQTLAAYQEACRSSRRGDVVQQARQAVAALSSDERRQVYDEIPPPPRGTATTGGR